MVFDAISDKYTSGYNIYKLIRIDFEKVKSILSALPKHLNDRRRGGEESENRF